MTSTFLRYDYDFITISSEIVINYTSRLRMSRLRVTLTVILSFRLWEPGIAVMYARVSLISTLPSLWEALFRPLRYNCVGGKLSTIRQRHWSPPKRHTSLPRFRRSSRNRFAHTRCSKDGFVKKNVFKKKYNILTQSSNFILTHVSSSWKTICFFGTFVYNLRCLSVNCLPVHRLKLIVST